MAISNESSDIWARANTKTSAQHGIDGSNPADAFFEIEPVHKLIERVGTDPDALSQLAARSSELTEAQRVAALKAATPPKEPKARKASKAKAKPEAAPAPRSFLGLSASRLGFGKAARS